MPVFHGLDKALRWQRLQLRRKQREVAQAAGITQAMLCSYEQGKRQPSLRTLEKILDTLEVDLPRLFQVLEVVRDSSAIADDSPPPGVRPPSAPPEPSRGHTRAANTGTTPASGSVDPNSPMVDLYSTLGTAHRLPAEQEQALSQMLQGFVSWLRILHRAAATPSPTPHSDILRTSENGK